MVRRNFVFPSPTFREITNEDTAKQFQNPLFQNGDALIECANMNTENTHVFVYDSGDDILAIMVFNDFGSFFHVEYLMANQLFNPQTAGTKLLLLLEDLGKTLGYDHIELDALVGAIPYYKHPRLGYTEVGVIQEGEYGKMSKMTKSLRN